MGLMGRRSLFALVVLVLALWVAPEARAEERHDGRVFLIVSLNGGAFEKPSLSCKCKNCKGGECYHDNRCGCWKGNNSAKRPKCCQTNCAHPAGSPIIVIPIGEFIAGWTVDSTLYKPGTVDPDFLINLLVDALGSFSGLDGAEYTIIGAVNTYGPFTEHLITPDDGAIDRSVQEAFFEAEPMILQDGDPLLTTTVELADDLYLNQDGTDPVTEQQLMDAVFQPAPAPDGAPARIVVSDTGTDALVECEGELFPHEPAAAVMSFKISLDENGNLSAESCTELHARFDLKPGSSTNPINLGSNGETPVAIYSTIAYKADGTTPETDALGNKVANFDAPKMIDGWTATLGAAGFPGAPAIKVSSEDVNNDGVKDLVLHFYTEDLVDADLGGLGESTTELLFHAEGFDGVGCFSGKDVVTPVPK